MDSIMTTLLSRGFTSRCLMREDEVNLSLRDGVVYVAGHAQYFFPNTWKIQEGQNLTWSTVCGWTLLGWHRVLLCWCCTEPLWRPANETAHTSVFIFSLLILFRNSRSITHLLLPWLPDLARNYEPGPRFPCKATSEKRKGTLMANKHSIFKTGQVWPDFTIAIICRHSTQRQPMNHLFSVGRRASSLPELDKEIVVDHKTPGKESCPFKNLHVIHPRTYLF